MDARHVGCPPCQSPEGTDANEDPWEQHFQGESRETTGMLQPGTASGPGAFGAFIVPRGGTGLQLGCQRMPSCQCQPICRVFPGGKPDLPFGVHSKNLSFSIPSAGTRPPSLCPDVLPDVAKGFPRILENIQTTGKGERVVSPPSGGKIPILVP